MRSQEIIDDGLSWGDNVNANDAGNLERRRRAFAFLKDVYDDVYTARPWTRRRNTETVTCLAGTGAIPVPWDYGRIGPYGGLWLVQGGLMMREPLDLVPEQEIIEIRSNGSYVDTPDRYAIFNLQRVGADAFRDLIQLPRNPVDLTFYFSYLRKTPRLLDAGDPDNWLTKAVTLVRVDATVTATTAQNHGFATDDYVVIAGATNPSYNGSFRIIVTGPMSFTYDLAAAAGTTPDAGTVRWDVQLFDANTANVPEEFHNCVICKGLRAKLRESKGDARWEKLEKDYTAALGGMKMERVRYESNMRRLPGFFGGR